VGIKSSTQVPRAWNRISIDFMLGQLEAADRNARELAASDAPTEIVEMANAIVLCLDASIEGELDKYDEVLSRIEKRQRASRNLHYLGITLLDRSMVAQCRGDAGGALAASSEAVDLISTAANVEASAAQIARAWALAHIGDWQGAVRQLRDAQSGARGFASVETYAESAKIWALYGDASEAERLLELAADGLSSNAIVRNEMVPFVQLLLAIRMGRLGQARAIQLQEAVPRFRTSPGEHARWLTYGALLQVLEGSADAPAAIANAATLATRLGLGLYVRGLRVLEALIAPDGPTRPLHRILKGDPAHVTLMAEAVVPRLADLGEDTFALLADEVRRRPERWRDPLRSALANPNQRSLRAAELLDQIGTHSDVALLRGVARALRRRGIGGRLGRDLARRLAPRVILEDIGRVQLRVGGRVMGELDVRRKVLSLMCFLITRPGYAATKDEVVDALWQDVDPVSGVNSLNQTLYFLRRVLEPSYSDDLSANYVRHESDVIWLEGSLVSSVSGLCRQLIERASEDPTEGPILALSRTYRGRFALDFAYDAWAEAYRDNLHAAYLETIERALPKLISRGQATIAIAVARRALAVDPEAQELEQVLLTAYHAIGAHAAVSQQYRRYASIMRDEMGMDPLPLDALIERQFELE
jgi:DNA-binding SARP family transcriptional activator